MGEQEQTDLVPVKNSILQLLLKLCILHVSSDDLHKAVPGDCLTLQQEPGLQLGFAASLVQ